MKKDVNGKIISSEAVSEEPIYINNCDCQRFCGIPASSRRENGRLDYQLLYIAKGVCYVTVDGEERAVNENSVIIYRPRQPQIYGFKGDADSVSYYVHFSGTRCEKILKELDLYEKFIIELSEKNGIENIFEKLTREFYIKKPFYRQNCDGMLLSLFSIIARSAKNIADKAPSDNNRIYDICRKMNETYRLNLTMSDYAEMLSLSTGRFMHIFTKTMGTSPKQYLMRIKLEHAAELLSNTDLPVARIAEMVGIADNNYFSRVFKKYMGHSPRFYR